VIATPTRPAPRRRLRAEDRRELILAAGARVFAERGYERAVMSEIAKHAGIAKSVVYDHFGSKRELYVALLERHAEALMSHVFERQAGGSSADVFRDRTTAFFEFVEHDRFAWRMLFREPPTGDPTIAALHAHIHSRARDSIRELLAAGRPAELEAGISRATANEMLAQAVKSVNDGLAAWWYGHPEIPRQVVCELAVKLAWQGIERLIAPRS
jgi:AcrR family transcriptional regulator